MNCSATEPPDRRSDGDGAPVPWAAGNAERPGASAVRSVAALRAVPVELNRLSARPLAHLDRPVPQRRLDNLSLALTSFIGREQEIAEIGRLLGMSRLVTLTGTGGVGKTRLGHEVAGGQLEVFEDGVWLVELAALVDARLVPQAVASVLGMREQVERSLTATLADALRSRQLLLVLDNCEHLLDACAMLADSLLRACPDLQMLATSRQALGIDGEIAYRVPSLSLSAPASTDAPTEAVRLFVERAQAAVPGFTLTDRNASAVGQICVRLDGIPLAIELAAARIAVLSPEQIAARLGDRFWLLTGGRRTAMPRHQTLQALLDWSYDLLDEREQVLLRRLAVFAGGWTLEAAESVCAVDGLGSDEILDLLAGLVTKSLVQTGEQLAEVRYWFQQSPRAYAVEKLAHASEEAMLRARHLDWFLALAERAEPELTGPDQEGWLDRLDRERENLRSAQRWAVARGDAAMIARLGAALWRFCWVRADASDAREWIRAISPLAQQAPPTPALARALHGAGVLAGSLADYAACRSLLGEGLAVARQLEDRHILAVVLDSLGRQAFVEARYPEARALLTEAMTLLREIDDRHALARALSHLGFLDYLEDRQESARAIYGEGLELAREAGDRDAVAEFYDNLGRTYQADGDFDGALRAFQAAEGIWREIGQAHRLAMALNNLGSVRTMRGDLDRARAQLAEALRLSERIGNRRRLAFTLAAVATLAAVEGEAERALRLDAASSTAVTEMGASLTQPMYARGAHYLARARQVLDPSTSAAAVATGQTMTLAQAVDEALAWLAEPRSSAPVGERPDGAASPGRDDGPSLVAVSPVQAAAPASFGGAVLSPRELEVAALIVRGMTNRQIATELVIAEGTAANHVKHILSRLGVDSRVQIAAWAIEHGLHGCKGT
jgi:predicted ATPase/DNA-binding CsgD family transcriptional regulator